VRLASLLALGLTLSSGCFEDPAPPVAEGGSTAGGSGTTVDPCDQGALGCGCFPNATCISGLTCVRGLCEPDESSTTTVAGSTGPDDTGPATTAVDSGSTGEASTDEGSSSGGGPAHVLFTTAEEFSGLEVIGLPEADAVCTSLGRGLRPGPWVAVLGDADTLIEDRITVTGDVVNVPGELLASTQEELLTAELQAIPGYDQDGTEISGSSLAWTGAAADDCMGWSSGEPKVLGTSGLPSSTELWLNTSVPLPCSAAVHLYCLSQ